MPLTQNPRKRFLLILVATVVISALAGIATARGIAAYRVRVAGDKARQWVRAEAEAESKRLAAHFSATVNTCDGVTLVVDATGPEPEIRSLDPAWLSRLSTLLQKSSYAPLSHGLWASTPELRLYRKGKLTLSLSSSGEVLRLIGGTPGGDFLVGGQTTAEFEKLARASAQ